MPNSQTGQSASDLIRRAMLTLGVLGSGETPEADEASDALDTLNDMLDAWDSDGLMIYTTRIDDFPITSAKQLYTLGSGGDFNIDRPAVIDRASIVILSNPAQPLEYPIPVYTTQDWQEKVPIKNSPGNIPLLVYDDGGLPAAQSDLLALCQRQHELPPVLVAASRQVHRSSHSSIVSARILSRHSLQPGP
jgi:hypothetical protein